MAIRAFEGRSPAIDPLASVDPSAQVIGEVTLGARSSVWCNCVVRGDVNSISIGEETNVQDLSCLHVRRSNPLRLGNRVTVGHGVMLHGCVVEDGCLIGIGAIVLDGAVIGAESLVAAGALVTPGTQVPPGSVVMGSPGTVRRSTTREERAEFLATAAGYVELARRHR